jgi:SAM-dependent methyltransferase
VTAPELPFTGERFTPECTREIWYEHWHRYAFAARLAPGRRVLDAACGEGYGAALLARAASSVLGLDLSEEAVAHASSRYASERLRFERADVAALDHLADGSFDLIVSFETLEHLAEQDALLRGFARLLAPGGVLMISTPDKRNYSDRTGYRNPHHVKELQRDEFERLLSAHFPARRLFAQKLLFQSVLWPADREARSVAADTAGADAWAVEPGLRYAPLYYLAACAASEADLPSWLDGVVALFGDAQESVYAHYNEEVGKHIAAGTRLMEAEARVAELTRERDALAERFALMTRAR